MRKNINIILRYSGSASNIFLREGGEMFVNAAFILTSCKCESNPVSWRNCLPRHIRLPSLFEFTILACKLQMSKTKEICALTTVNYFTMRQLNSILKYYIIRCR